MPASDSVFDRTACQTLLRLAVGTLPVLLVAALLHLFLLAALTWTSLGGAPLVRRLLPLATPGTESYALARFQEVRSAPSTDLLIIGPSASFVSLSPEPFAKAGLHARTLGSNSQTPLNSHALLASHLPTLKPKVVLFVVSQQALSLDGLESHAELVSNLRPNRHLLAMTWHQGSPTAWNLTLAAFLRQLHTPVEAFSQTPLPHESYLPGGFVATDRPFRLHALPPSLRIQPLARQKQWLQRCIDLVRSQGAIPIAASLPIHSELQNRISGFDQGQEDLADLLALTNVPFLNLLKSASGISDSDFYDVYHLRPSGARKASQAIASWTLELHLFPPPALHRSP